MIRRLVGVALLGEGCQTAPAPTPLPVSPAVLLLDPATLALPLQLH